MSVKERLKQFIEYKGISQRQFERSIGASNAYVKNIRSSIAPEKLTIITSVYPELNTVWLLTGNGEMLAKEIEQTTTPESNEDITIPAKVWNVIKMQAESLAEKDAQITELINLLKKGNAHLDTDAICADASGFDSVK